MDGGVGGGRVVKGAVVVIMEAGGGGGRGGAGMLRRHNSSMQQLGQGCGTVDPRAAAVTSRHARPGCWCRVEARDSRGCDDETTLIDEASEPEATVHVVLYCSSDERRERHSWRNMYQSGLYALATKVIVNCQQM